MMLRQQSMEPVEELANHLQSLGQLVVSQVTRAIYALRDGDVDTARQIVAEDIRVNRARTAIDAEVVQTIVTQHPAAGDLRRLLTVLDVASELERVGDYARKIAIIGLEQVQCPAQPPESLAKLARAACTMLTVSLMAQQHDDIVAAQHLGIDDDQVDALYQQAMVDLIHIAQTAPAMVIWVAHLMMIAHVLERIADRAANIGERTIFLLTGEMRELNP